MGGSATYSVGMWSLVNEMKAAIAGGCYWLKYGSAKDNETRLFWKRLCLETIVWFVWNLKWAWLIWTLKCCWCGDCTAAHRGKEGQPVEVRYKNMQMGYNSWKAVAWMLRRKGSVPCKRFRYPRNIFVKDCVQMSGSCGAVGGAYEVSLSLLQ